MSHKLERELETYEQNKDDLLKTAEGKYVLIADDRILGVFDTQRDGIRQGYKELGNRPFLVKQILQIEPVIYFIGPVFE